MSKHLVSHGPVAAGAPVPVELTGDDGANTLNGGDGDDMLSGLGGDDVLDGKAGADTMDGGTGGDTFHVDNIGDIVIEGASAGYDTVISSVSYTLGNNVERLSLTGHENVDATGNSLRNVIGGNSGDNRIDGGFGQDTMIGHGGNDTYIVDRFDDVVTEKAGEGSDSVEAWSTWHMSANVEYLTLRGEGATFGSGNASDNTITGNTGANTLYGSGGDDILNGGLGADHMIGGIGDDVFYVGDAGDWVSDYAGQGTDTVYSTLDYSLGANLENLTLNGDAVTGRGNHLGNVLDGNSRDNVLFGFSGDDTIDGSAGADRMIGGMGDDSYYVDNGHDRVFEHAGQGADVVHASVSYTLSDNIENLILTGEASNGRGNGLDNTIVGNDHANRIDGGAGDDNLTGGLGADIFMFGVDSGNDTITDFNGRDGDRIDITVAQGFTMTVTQLGTDVVIDAGDGNTVTVLNMSATDPHLLSWIV